MSYGVDVGYTGCCGFRELHCFDEGDLDWRDYQADSPTALIKGVEDDQANGQLLHMWFIRNKRFDGTHDDNYQWSEVRDYVMQLPDVVHLGEHINPNTGNIIDGYMWKVI